MRRVGLGPMLLGPLIAALVVGSALLGFFIHRSVERDQIAAIDSELVRALPIALDDRNPSLRPDGARVPPDADVTFGQAPQDLIIDQDGAPTGPIGSAAELASRDLSEFIGVRALQTIDGDPRLRVTSRPQPDGTTALVAFSLADVDASLASLRRSLLIGTGVLLVVQALIARWVVSSVRRPIARLSDSAHRVAAGELAAPIGPASGPAEVHSLTADMESMVGRLRTTIEERERAAMVAERAREDMQQFMADASHELRTPLTAISGYADLHQQGMLRADDVDRAMGRIGAESERLRELANDLLRLVRPTDPDAVGPVDIGAVASAVVHDLRAANPNHNLQIDLCPGELVVQGDDRRLHQALLNVAGNACHHTPDGSSVAVTVERTDGRVSVIVDDDGSGFDLDVAESALEPFTRADRSRSRDSHDGAGLGLSITRRIVEQHGGTVTLGAAPAGGARVRLDLPDGRSPDIRT